MQELLRLEHTPIVVVEVAAVGAATSSLLLKCRQPKSCRRFHEYSRRCCSIITVAHVVEVTECRRRAAAAAVQTQVLLLLLRRRGRCRRRAATAAAQKMQVRTAAAALRR